MKRLALFVVVMIPATAAVAFNPSAVPVAGSRIGILNSAAGEEDLLTLRVASMMRGPLARELRKAGLDVFDIRATFDEIQRNPDRNDADYYVEFVRGDADDSYYAGVGVAGRHGGVDLGMGTASITARLRVYDGRTLDELDEIFVEASDRSVMPTSIGIGTRTGGLWLGVPVRLMRGRAVARQAARDAAESIVSLLESEARGD